ncbi:hypothetical protein [Pseudonocardia acidicola]|uniref:DUF3558 domain-containing protein n=1 Tax=Pseudonocardia acidicola TaxID=2724939 RepID=A0ABX1SHY3_9PSEU|nr:hypothetical protein [Pseudonocardia acidicola]NMI01197.1 hypothetical protein [Pseudonocardia acidicola]
MRFRRLPVAVALVVLVTLPAGACSTRAAPGPGGPPPAAATRPPASSAAPLPAGADPSDISRMVCGKAQPDIAAALGVTPVRVDTPAWVDHVYSCRYVYPTGSFVVSVKELSSWPETFAYVDGLGQQLGNTRELHGLGEGAFTTSNGSVVARKDWKVLLVDDSALPAQFGSPPTTPASTALIVANVIMGCWAGD